MTEYPMTTCKVIHHGKFKLTSPKPRNKVAMTKVFMDPFSSILDTKFLEIAFGKKTHVRL